MSLRLPLVLALMGSVLWTGSASAQTSEMSIEQQGPAGNQVEVFISCTAGVFTPLNDDYLMIWLGLVVDGTIRAQDWQQGEGYVTAYAAASVVIDRSDVHAECALTSNWISDYRSRVYTRRTPTQVSSDSYSPFMYYGLGNYERVKFYNVIDNYGVPYGYTDAAVEEEWVINEHGNGCNIVGISTGSANLNNEGRFEDTYGTLGQPLAACAVVPDCTSILQQEYTIDGVSHFMHNAAFGCYDVVVGR